MALEPLSYLSMTIIMIPILLMAAQNLSMLTGKWRNYYVVLFFVKILLTSIIAPNPSKVPLAGFDWANYTRNALLLLEEYPNSLFGIISSAQTLFVKEVAVGYYLFGINRTYISFVVCFGSLIAFKYLVLMVKEMTEDYELAQKCGIIYLVYPTMLLYASTFLRENQSNLLIILSFYNFVKFVKKHNFNNYACAIFWAILGAMTHSSMIAFVAGYAIFGSMCSKSGEIKFSPTKIIFGFLLLFALMASPFSSGMTEYFRGAEDASSLEEFTDAISTEATEANTTYIASTPSNPIKLLLLEPYLFVMFVFSPFPFQIRSVSHAVAFLIDAVPQFFLVRAAYLYLVVQRNKGTSQIKGYKTMGLWLLLFFYFICSFGVTCFGTAIRHRAKVTPLLIAFAVMYYAEKKGVAVGTKEKERKERDFETKPIRIPIYARGAFLWRKLSGRFLLRRMLRRKRRVRFVKRTPVFRRPPRRILPFTSYVPFSFFPERQGKVKPFDDSSFERDETPIKED